MTSYFQEAPQKDISKQRLEEKGLVRIMIRNNPRVCIELDKEMFDLLNEKIGEVVKKHTEKFSDGEYVLLLSKRKHSLSEESRKVRSENLKAHRINKNELSHFKKQ